MHLMFRPRKTEDRPRETGDRPRETEDRPTSLSVPLSSLLTTGEPVGL